MIHPTTTKEPSPPILTQRTGDSRSESFHHQPSHPNQPQPNIGDYDFNERSAGTYTAEDLEELKMMGMTKPEGVTWADWNSPRKMSNKHKLLAHLAAAGCAAKDIADELGLSVGRVQNLMNSQAIREHISHIQARQYGKQARSKLDALFDPAVDVVKEILQSSQEKGGVKLDAAKYVIDQKVGKAKQEVQVRGSILHELITRLDAIDQAKDVTPEVRELLDPPKEPSNSFIEELIPENIIVGNRGRA